MSNANGVFLGWPLDHLLNRDSRLDASNVKSQHPGLRLPTATDPGSGSIVIQGKAGTGKSTLGMQFAIRCCQPPNGFMAAYVALEQPVPAVEKKAAMFGWSKYIRVVRQPPIPLENASPEELGRALWNIVTQHPDCWLHREVRDREDKCNNQHAAGSDAGVLLLTLSPRPFASEPSGGELFRERYAEFERLLVAAEALPSGVPPLRLICVDSLNMFGAGRHPTREEMFRLFDLCRRHKVIGVFLVEGGEETPYDSTIADVVINLSCDTSSGYFLQHLEIEKSRYVYQVYGKHAYKMAPPKEWRGDREDGVPFLDENIETGSPLYGVRVLPSLHYLVANTSGKADPT